LGLLLVCYCNATAMLLQCYWTGASPATEDEEPRDEEPRDEEPPGEEPPHCHWIATGRRPVRRRKDFSLTKRHPPRGRLRLPKATAPRPAGSHGASRSLAGVCKITQVWFGPSLPPPPPPHPSPPPGEDSRGKESPGEESPNEGFPEGERRGEQPLDEERYGVKHTR